jgi:pyridoxal phosphate enzyme (YggS family)
LNNTLESSYADLKDRIKRAEITPSSVTLIAVSKMQSVESIEALYRLGQRDFGENYAQELLEKSSLLSARGCHEIRWHFIGHLQTNKVKALLPVVHAIHSVDSEKLAAEIGKRKQEQSAPSPLAVFVEVNLGREPKKTGAPPERAVPLTHYVASLGEKVRLEGLMCVPESGLENEGLCARFRELRELEKQCRPATRGQLSMGMSHDFELAISQGATHVRVGTALFGPRPSPA